MREKGVKAIPESINKKSAYKRFRINSFLVDVDYIIRTKLMELSEDDAVRILEKKFISGREGFFCLKSSKNLIRTEALLTYRKKRTRMTIFNSLKNEIEIKSLWAWTDNRI